MLVHYVTSPVSYSRLQSTPCWPYLDDFTDWLAEKRFTRTTVQLYLFGIPPLGQWLVSNAISVPDFDNHSLTAFRRERGEVGKLYHSNGRKLKAAFIGAHRFQEFLVARNIVAKPSSLLPVSPLLSEFEQWMSVHRGLRKSTLSSYARYIKKFIATLGHEPETYDASGIRDYFQDYARRSNVPSMRLAATSIRAFLIYLVASGRCDSTLSGVVPTIAEWRLSPLPRYLASKDVEQLIQSCDGLIKTMRRDRAVLLLLARLALRAGDVATLELADIDWHEGRIRVSGKNRREFWLPLTQELGDALVDYWQNERHESDEPSFFLKCIAPTGPLSTSVVSSIVHRAIIRAGIDAPSRGAHLLRHSAATAMLANGANLEQIGSVLRHVNLDTTAIYAKVDIGLLGEVMAPWPSDREAVDCSVSLDTGHGVGTC